jgi:16S rRNA C967 or C1407 C5-methylase (RsmB/RsmF family)
MCSSPGGKTTHIADIMRNTGLIIANELYPSRHIPLSDTVSRLGIINVVLTAYQAQEFPLRQKFDYILADVPCSGEGRFRINSRNKKKGFENVMTSQRQRLLDLQRKIIIRGFDLLSAKGNMLYSTCTYNPEENESVLNYLLRSRDAVLLPIDLDFNYEPGIIKWGEEVYDKQMELATRFYPHQTDSVGFFMARIGRR